MKRALSITLFAGLLTACSDPEPQVSIEAWEHTNRHTGGTYFVIEITSIEEQVTVEDMLVNRGNCDYSDKTPYSRKPYLPTDLKYGESIELKIYDDCSLTEIEVVTDSGSTVVNY
ncbi:MULTISPECIES: hypothetical protein [Idiomarina]|jgi:hypothetical protein|uniref:hypothetical protein n=1 Tax=Idiomarina TaxID=135575 RepID=UPI000C09C623|nr:MULTISPECIES: hypothetical protein [Idiomarina]MAC34945.1 hypothetical protein [Haliea sp.]MAO66845.1 hypothetical protein [Idiomarina sp.]MEC7643118.1 hypothetical protein [Pseudomonadota bacterium]NQZ15339.1 hypothetical protein [Idiomarina sp.]|tara:strand:+ start:3637 stop:3981 length:345 start_codon:yes stop_codon:yes gene_type:complete